MNWVMMFLSRGDPESRDLDLRPSAERFSINSKLALRLDVYKYNQTQKYIFTFFTVCIQSQTQSRTVFLIYFHYSGML